ncbi:TIGR03545 family protein [Bdellovibrio svalbardensis]|uniref:TIGR03545 family protein n=1 Tax=Bdellovibrio svalbardensis TaxID=2972972 RepID=A0ABT6DFW6_9BACT|nr:TIGR03545 family protein [Bdellovibrio svalbardensis]MDG0815740.1 TIGR03545 family protein [Bdellovibrio svalbardensis]
MTTEINSLPKKKKGIIRWGAIIPFTIISLLVGLYFHFFFDGHLRRGMEWVGYKALGAEVNIADLKTSFFDASIRIQGIELTDAEKPTHDSIKIGDVRFSMLWDALLRVKFVINEAAVEQIEFGVKRQSPGKVAPPPPVSNEPGVLSTEGGKLKADAQKELEARYGDNVLGDVIGMLSGTDPNAQLQKLQETLPSKAMIEKFQKDLESKQQTWDARLKNLPQGKDIQALGDRLNKIQYKDFKSPQELTSALQQLDAVYKDADGKYKQIQAVTDDLGKDLKALQTQYQDIEKQVKVDIKSLEQHFKIPQLDAKALTMAVFSRYLAPYKAKFFRYKDLAEKYLPPKFLKKGQDKTEEEEVAIQPHPREKGISYEFGRPNSYPMFWLKRTAVSSQAGSSPNAGNIKGEILDITSNQRLIGRPTVATLAGDFPGMQIFGFLAKLSLDNRKDDAIIKYLLKVDSYALEGKELVQSPDVHIAFNKATGALGIEGSLVGFKDLNVSLDNKFTKIDYSVSSKNEIADQILKAVFAGIPVVTLTAQGQGVLPKVDLAINSNLGPELQKGFEKQIQAKIDEARKKIQAYVEQEIGKQKAQVEAELNKLKSQFEGEIKKAQVQLDDQKKQVESKVNSAKKDAENQGKKQLEEQGKKALDDLKKQFGW